jgi:hypothetical protein
VFRESRFSIIRGILCLISRALLEASHPVGSIMQWRSKMIKCATFTENFRSARVENDDEEQAKTWGRNNADWSFASNL